MRRLTAILTAVDLILTMTACGERISTQKSLTDGSQANESISATTYMPLAEDFAERLTGVKSDPYVSNCLGTFRCTFYTASKEYGKLTYSGVEATHLASCAVDPNVIPLGSTIKIVGANGQALVLKCLDIGGGIKGNKVDIFWDGSVADGYKWIAEFGDYNTVYLLEE